MTLTRPRKPRYTKPLSKGNDVPNIPSIWDELKPVPLGQCDMRFLSILEKCGFGRIQPVVPLQVRYSRGRRWTENEFQACFSAWQSEISLTLIAAALNRNPQDIIFRLLDYCDKLDIEFTERGRSEGSENWKPPVVECARELFEAGLPAWKIASLFKVDFEHVEKQLFIGRSDYGHRKKNPFGINTDHKHFVNARILAQRKIDVLDAFDAFAGEGKSTAIIEDVFPKARILAVESDQQTFEKSQRQVWNRSTVWVNQDNIPVMNSLVHEGRHFDLIDLDPFVTCHEQLRQVWRLLKSEAYLFVTFGGEYRRSFISSNRKAIVKRYGFNNNNLNNKDYLEIVPYFFLGWVAKLASNNCYTFTVFRAVRYANNCRFWLRMRKETPKAAKEWFSRNATPRYGGFQFETLHLPRFAEVRRELEEKSQTSLFQ